MIATACLMNPRQVTSWRETYTRLTTVGVTGATARTLFIKNCKICIYHAAMDCPGSCVSACTQYAIITWCCATIYWITGQLIFTKWNKNCFSFNSEKLLVINRQFTNFRCNVMWTGLYYDSICLFVWLQKFLRKMVACCWWTGKTDKKLLSVYRDLNPNIQKRSLSN
jgi:hypothetical protein